ncbi:hypothetical protein BDW74DRAFT_147954, partial [Aspergillus multicolor]|uniref:uncharacterized protein n=1 Tax=Aspergillus multicolor TaxID=41759 RepID=UPI003CCDBB45
MTSSDVMTGRARNLEVPDTGEDGDAERENTERRFLPEMLTGEPPHDFSTENSMGSSSSHHLSRSLSRSLFSLRISPPFFPSVADFVPCPRRHSRLSGCDRESEDQPNSALECHLPPDRAQLSKRTFSDGSTTSWFPRSECVIGLEALGKTWKILFPPPPG